MRVFAATKCFLFLVMLTLSLGSNAGQQPIELHYSLGSTTRIVIRIESETQVALYTLPLRFKTDRTVEFRRLSTKGFFPTRIHLFSRSIAVA